MVYPGAGVGNSTGSAWGTSYAVGTAANDLVQLNGSIQLPSVSGALLTNIPITLTTTGTSGPATYTQSINTLNVPQYSPPTVTISTSGPVSDPGGAAVFLVNNTSGGLTFTTAVGVAGYQRCYRNATGKTSVITVAVPASNAIDLNGVNGTTGTGTLVSGGALGDAVCLFSDASNHWYAQISEGTWINH